MNQLFTVTITDLGEYEVTVAACNAAEACAIAQKALFEEATKLPPGMRLIKRDADTKTELKTEVPVRQYDVDATYTVRFSIRVPANSSEEAQRHARRIYDAEPFPWEHGVCDDRIRWDTAVEVRS